MKITDALVAEHTIFLGVFDQIEKALPSLATPAEIRTMASIVEGMLEGHSSRESNFAYLALDHVLAHQGELERLHQDHHELDARLKKVQAAASCAEARRLLKAVLSASREHFRLEERTLFPLMEKTLQPDTLVSLGQSWISRASAPAQI